MGGSLLHALTLNIITSIVFLPTLAIFHVLATNHTVGDSTGWDLTSNLQNWSSSRTFFTGDNLEFIYGPNHDVLEVNQDAFDKCQKNAPITTHNDGDTIVPLDKPGNRYFICGTNGHCESGLKVQVDVLPSPGNSTGDDTDRRKRPPGLPRPPSPASLSPPHSPPSPNHDHEPPEVPDLPVVPGPESPSSAYVQCKITGFLSLAPLIIMLFH